MMNRNNIRNNMNRNNIGTLEKGLIVLCYSIGMGSILFGSLSGTNYSYHFIVIGILALVLVIIHTCRREARYVGNIEKKEST